MEQSKIQNFFKKNKITSDIISAPKKEVLVKNSRLTSVNPKGLYFYLKTTQIKMPETSFLTSFLNHPVELFLSEYELSVNGVIKKISLIGKDLVEIHVGFSENTPKFYKECFVDLVI